MAFLDDEEMAYREEEDEDEFSALASEVFPDVDPEQYPNLKRMIELCAREARGDDDMGPPPGKKGGGLGIILELGGKPKK